MKAIKNWRAALCVALVCVSALASGGQVEQNKRDVELWYRAFDQNDPGLLERIVGKDWIDIPAAADQAPGSEGAKEVLHHLHSTFSDFSIKIEEVLQDGDKVIVRSRISGIQTGVFVGVAPTGKRIDIRATDIHEFKNGKIVRTWHMEDWMTGLHQLGVLKR
ncbi:ester cyclase [Pseudomonas sp. GZD-222]|uniref:ester cyclase n=1 Tax=Pseudomonas sp. GZD-222 TaxID=3404805 RepID=UPI003BB5B94B